MPLLEKYAFRKNGCAGGTWGDDGTRQTLRFAGPCVYCKKEQSVRVDAEAAVKFQNGGFAQDCFPELSAAEREFLISGICGQCWDKMFKDDETDIS